HIDARGDALRLPSRPDCRRYACCRSQSSVYRFYSRHPTAARGVKTRYQLGKSFSVTPQARKLVTQGLNPKFAIIQSSQSNLPVRHGSDSRIGSRFAVAQPVDCASGINSDPDPACPPGSESPGEKIRRRIPRVQTQDLVLRRAKPSQACCVGVSFAVQQTTRCVLY